MVTARWFWEACIRCPMLKSNPKMLSRFSEIEDLVGAERAPNPRLGEIEGIDRTLFFLRQKRSETLADTT